MTSSVLQRKRRGQGDQVHLITDLACVPPTEKCCLQSLTHAKFSNCFQQPYSRIQEITQRFSKTSYDFPKVMKVLGIQKAKGNFAEITVYKLITKIAIFRCKLKAFLAHYCSHSKVNQKYHQVTSRHTTQLSDFKVPP